MKTLRLAVVGFTVALLSLAMPSSQCRAQVNAQLFYDLGSDRKYVTLTLEMFKADPWGNTFFFIDTDFNQHKLTGDKAVAPGGTYMEIARCLNFWQSTPLAPLSLHVEYNGGLTQAYPINSAFLAGVEYGLHSADWKRTLNFQVLYKHIWSRHQVLPLQFTAVWGWQDMLGVKGLVFSGYADFWFEDHACDFDATGTPAHTRRNVFQSEPQLWYALGQHFGVKNLSVGTEFELSQHFGDQSGFKCRPCVGVKWDF